MKIAKGSFAAILALAGCGPINSGHETSMIVDDGAIADASRADAVVAIDPTEDGLACASAIVLASDSTLTDQHTPPAGDSATACTATTAPQRFYRVDLPPHSRAVVIAKATALSCPWPIVLRVVSGCDASTCVAEVRSDADGAPVSLRIEGSEDAAVGRIVSVSGTSASEGGAFDVTVQLESE
jgi:hypothetical protein